MGSYLSLNGMKIKAVVWKTTQILLEMHISKQRKEKEIIGISLCWLLKLTLTGKYLGDVLDYKTSVDHIELN